MPALPIDYLTRKTSVPSQLRTAEWDRVPLWIRERSFFMAGVDDAEILDRFRAEAEAIARGESSESESRLRLRDFLNARGYQPAPGEEGTIRDLRTVRRMNIALRTNVEMARGWAQWQAQNAPGAIDAYPARRYHRGRQVDVPRDWPARWRAAISATAPEGATDGDGEMIALLNHPLWIDPEFNRFGMPHTPFDFNSGMTTSPVDRDRATELGLMPDPADKSEAAEFQRGLLRPGHRAMNETLEASPAVESQALRDALADRLAGFARWSRDEEEGAERLVFTDPNGTRPGEPEEIAETISAPLPTDPETGEPFPQMQADALDLFAEDPESFAEGAEREVWHDLARLTARIAADERSRRGWLSRLVEESREPAPPSWIDAAAAALVNLPAWRNATSIPARVARYAAMLRILRGFVS
jgi:hypothetical protein